MKTRVAAGSRRLLDETRDLVAERVDLEQEPDLEALVLAQFDEPVEDRLPVAVAGEIIVGDEKPGHVLGGVGAHDRLDVIGGAVARLAPLHVDDGAERALERAAAAGVEARVVPGDPGHDRARQNGNRRRGHVRHVVEVIVDRFCRAGVDVLEEVSQAAFALACVEDHPQRLRLLQVRRQFGQHGDASRDMEAADGDGHARFAKLAPDVERARKLIRLHPDQRDHAAVGQDAARDRGNVDDGVALVVNLDLDVDLGAENAGFGAFGEQAIDARETVRRDRRAPPLDDVAVAVVVRRLDQSDRESALRHARPWERRTGVDSKALSIGRTRSEA